MAVGFQQMDRCGSAQMSVDLNRLPLDEEALRKHRIGLNEAGHQTLASEVQNVLDALNFYRCRAAFAEQELARANAELIEVRNSAEHNRIYGGSYGLA